MRKSLLIAIFFGSALLTVGCETEIKPTSMTRFFITVNGYDVDTNDFPGSDFATQLPFNKFHHKFAPSTLIFKRSDDYSIRVNTEEKGLTEYPFKIPPGDYTLYGSGGRRDYFEDGKIGYYIDEQKILITDTTTIIEIHARPICGMIMIVDDDKQIEECRIYNGDYSFPFIELDSIHYMYCFPHSDTQAYVKRKDGSKKYIYLAVYGIGYIHKMLSSDL